ncbi:thioredoxin domain-containing protein 15 [Atheta coriaria]|uniref:thioredoxin domain-containing protein 15 n=1 Tax=Dalotia coriaria TaxID=877792 RepID=UPI0031F3B866
MSTGNLFYCLLIISTFIISGCVSDHVQITIETEFQDEVDLNEPPPPLEHVDAAPDNIISENVTISAANDEPTVTFSYESTNVTIKQQVNCLLEMGSSQVQIVNDTELIKLLLPNPNITSRDTPGNCLCVLFFSKHCPFSSLAAPHFNALPRAFPDLQMVAINAIMYHLFNTQNGIVGVPSLLLLHNGKIIDKFNESDYTLEQFSRFITKNTGIPAAEKSFVTSADFSGPVASAPSNETDILLVSSWCFIVFCAVYYFSRSKWWRWIVESVKHNWRESEAQAQHEHAD